MEINLHSAQKGVDLLEPLELIKKTSFVIHLTIFNDFIKQLFLNIYCWANKKNTKFVVKIISRSTNY